MAKRFVFRLDSVLALHKRHEQEQQRVVAERAKTVREEEQASAALCVRLTEAVERSRRARAEAVTNVEAELQDQRWQLLLKRRIERQGDRIAASTRVLDETRAELLSRSKRRKAVEKLRERRWAEYVAKVRRAEQIEADETAGRIHMQGAGRFAGSSVFGGA